MKRLTPEDIRREALTAIFAHDAFFHHGALKGGTALELALRIGSRSSLDIDLSIEGDFEDPTAAQLNLQRLMEDHFSSLGHRLFDYAFTFQPPRDDVPNDWGGYRIEFKVIPTDSYRIDAREANLRKAIEYHQRKFKLDISRAEYIGVPMEVEVGPANIWRVYTPELIVCEKLRALCQQLPAYASHRQLRPRRRPRDFYDIHSILSSGRGVTPSSASFEHSLRHCFAAKAVGLELLGQTTTEESYEFHLGDWDSVTNAVVGEMNEFRFYFDVVSDLIRDELRALWDV